MDVFELGKLDKRLGLPFRQEYETWNYILQNKYESGRFAQIDSDLGWGFDKNAFEYEERALLETRAGQRLEYYSMAGMFARIDNEFTNVDNIY